MQAAAAMDAQRTVAFFHCVPCVKRNVSQRKLNGKFKCPSTQFDWNLLPLPTKNKIEHPINFLNLTKHCGLA